MKDEILTLSFIDILNKESANFKIFIQYKYCNTAAKYLVIVSEHKSTSSSGYKNALPGEVNMQIDIALLPIHMIVK